MRKNIQKLKTLLSAMVFGVACIVATPVSVSAESALVYDGAQLLEKADAVEIQSALAALEDKTGWELMVLTIEDAAGNSTREYSEEFLDGNLSGDDGIVYTIDMDNREVYIATTGDAIYYLTDARIEDVIDEGYSYVTSGDYAEAFLEMIDATGDWYDAGIPSDQYTYDTDTGEIVRYQEPKTLKWYEILIAFAIAAGVFAIVFTGVLGKYRLKWGTYKYDFHGNSRLNLKHKEDRFVNQFVTHRHIPKQTSSGGSSGSRSSVHSGSGGRSYGGGGRKF